MDTTSNSQEPAIIARKRVLHPIGSTEILVLDSGKVYVDFQGVRYLGESDLRLLISQMENWTADKVAT